MNDPVVKKRKKKGIQIKQTLKFELYGLILLAFAVLAFVQPGVVGESFTYVFRFFAGSWDFLIPTVIAIIAIYVIINRKWPSQLNSRWIGLIILCVASLLLFHIEFMKAVTDNGRFNISAIQATWQAYLDDVAVINSTPREDLGGGMIGAVLFGTLYVLIGWTGVWLIFFFLVLIGLLLLTGISYLDILLGCKRWAKNSWQWVGDKKRALVSNLKLAEEERERKMALKHSEQQRTKSISKDKNEAITSQEHADLKAQSNGMPDPQIYDFTDVAYQENNSHVLPHEQNTKLRGHSQDPSIDGQNVVNYEDQLLHHTGSVVTSSDVIAYTDEEQEYHLPSFALLKKQPKQENMQKGNMKSNARKLEQTLESFGVSAQVTQVHRGPAVTRYEVYPAAGVKVSRIVNLVDDIALALAAKGIRIEAPIPGKSAIGIEVPNDDVSIVTLRDVIESSTFHESHSKLSIALGRDISGEPIVGHLNQMPHLLVAGATGSGKSVCINGIIASIIYKAKPHEVKMLMIDPKMVELNVYNGIPHLLTPVVTDPRKASMALKKVVSEMEQRYELFSQSGTRDIEKYNALVRKENEKDAEAQKPFLPYIVVIIDELADLMMVAAKDVEDAICRLAQMARAAGIHLIIATQRPSVDVITGVIKSNIPSRIAFAVSSQVDSRTIIDGGGAEKLIGKGDMLYLPAGASKPMRIQGVFLSDKEVEAIVGHCIEQQKAKYIENIVPEVTDEQSTPEVQEDELYQQAVDLVIKQGTASVSYLQRKLRIGYTRSARMIDAMEDNGVVGPYEGSKPREVLVSKDQSNIS